MQDKKVQEVGDKGTQGGRFCPPCPLPLLSTVNPAYIPSMESSSAGSIRGDKKAINRLRW